MGGRGFEEQPPMSLRLTQQVKKCTYGFCRKVKAYAGVFSFELDLTQLHNPNPNTRKGCMSEHVAEFRGFCRMNRCGHDQ